MSTLLERAIAEARSALPEQEQDRLAVLIGEFIGEVRSGSSDDGLTDPRYLANVLQELERSEEDRESGKLHSANETFSELKSGYRAKHGL